MSSGIALRVEGIEKSFGAVRALKGVSFEVLAGEVHGLVGENGAGKSTLMGVAAGTVEPDAGSIEIAGRTLGRSNAREAEALGLVVVYQNPALVAELTVLENLLVAVPANLRSKDGGHRRWAREQLQRVLLEIDLDQRVGELVPGERQLLEIAKALARRPKVLILDEPTESLGAEAVERLTDLIREEAAAGTAVVYISHRIAEVRAVATKVTALRDGQIAGTVDIADVDEKKIVEMVVGRPISDVFPAKAEGSSDGQPLVVSGLSGEGFSDVSLEVEPGKILGLAGVEGNGQREFLRALAGLGRVESGSVAMAAEQIDVRHAADVAAAGVRFIPADRLSEGLAENFSVGENVVSDSLGSVSRFGLVSAKRERNAVAGEMRATSIKAASPDAPLSSLSGGNQQKVMFARAMLSRPKVLLCDEPTRGVDVGARAEIYSLVRSLAGSGTPVLVLSADAAELASLCDQVAVFSRGRVVEVLGGETLTEDNIVGGALRARRSSEDGEAAQRSARARGSALRRLGDRWPGLSRLSRSDSFPAGILALVAVLIAAYTASKQPTFLSEFSIPFLLLSISILAFVALGQQVVILAGGMDLSVGPAMGLIIVVMSYQLSEGKSSAGLLLGVGVCLVVAVGIGLLHGALIIGMSLAPIIATLGTYIAFQGASLLVREQAGGSIAYDFIEVVTYQVGPIPVVFVLALAVAVIAEVVSRHTNYGYALRSVGPGGESARRIGIRVNWVTLSAYVGCALLTMIAAFILGAQIGMGDSSPGLAYTLSSISAVVLGGASIYGGRGSFVGAFAGATVIALIANATAYLGLEEAWQFWVPGLIILAAAAVSARTKAANG